jgi:hypothetical protein
MISLRLYLGWAYIGNRLFSATVEYEETGWYDGQVSSLQQKFIPKIDIVAHKKGLFFRLLVKAQGYDGRK